MTGYGSAPAPVALHAEHLSRTFGDRRVVDDVSLSVRDGEILTLVGPSGCGKSTLARLIAGLERPDAGRVRIGDLDVTDAAPEKRRIGFVFQEASLFGHLRVAENVGFGLRGLDRRARAERVAEMLELVQLPGAGRRRPHELSGGEQQRVALARALAPRPRVMLLDEPFASLDEVLREEIGRQVAGILRAAGTAAILVTHDRREAMSLGDTVAVMGEGAIVQCDVPAVVYGRPVDRFVAGFLGDCSFVPASGGGVHVVRPHDATVTAGGPDTVERIEFLGETHRVTVVRADGSRLLVDTADVGGLVVGGPCTATVEPGTLHRLE